MTHITRLNRIKELRKAGAVGRYHTTTTIRTQSVGEHSFGVALLVLYLNPKASSRLLSACLWHDLPELVTGDIPAPVKWGCKDLVDVLERLEQQFRDRHRLNVVLTNAEERMLRFCDMCECVLWCKEEVEMGNTTVEPIIKRAMLKLHDMEFPNDKAEELYYGLSKR